MCERHLAAGFTPMFIDPRTCFPSGKMWFAAIGDLIHLSYKVVPSCKLAYNPQKTRNICLPEILGPNKSPSWLRTGCLVTYSGSFKFQGRWAGSISSVRLSTWSLEMWRRGMCTWPAPRKRCAPDSEKRGRCRGDEAWRHGQDCSNIA